MNLPAPQQGKTGSSRNQRNEVVPVERPHAPNSATFSCLATPQLNAENIRVRDGELLEAGL
jgi:hypothetical protein